jgi:adenylate cyclase
MTPKTVADLEGCFEGVVPAVIATASAEGTPNVTYLSRVHLVDEERVALSNQFFSKTSRNLAENPRASVLLIDPSTYHQWRLTLVYERTERRGAVFDRLREDIDALAAIEGMQGIFQLRAADIYRVVAIEWAAPSEPPQGAPTSVDSGEQARAAQVAQLTARLGRAADLDVLVATAVDGLASLLGYEHSAILLLDEPGERLYTIASHGFPEEGVGSEIAVGDGIVGMAAARAAPMRVGNLRQMTKYSRSVRRSYEGGEQPGREIALPALPEAQSRVAVPAMALGELVGVLVVESTDHSAFSEDDVDLLGTVASVLGYAIESTRLRAQMEPGPAARQAPPPEASGGSTLVRFFEVDGSTFLAGDYLIKGVAARILWSLLCEHERSGRTDFTNREVRLDPALELPQFRDNFESRLILLKRRLDERGAPLRIEKTGRGRFRLVVDHPLHLELVAAEAERTD